MPHLILQTKFPATEATAEVSFYGSVERETMQAVQLATCGALQSSVDLSAMQVGFWQQSPHAPNVTQFVVNLPGTWECRRTLQNVLRVLWLDVFERAGWSVASASNCEHGGLPAVSSPAGLTADPKAPSGFKGECTNFILFKHAPSTGMFAHGIDHRKTNVAASHPAGVLSSIGSDDGVKHDGGDDGDGGSTSPRSHGLPLPEVVQRLLRENNVLRWDPADRHYVVLDGSRFEDRFNQLRKVRQKHKNGTVERPFSRMHNFYHLDRGDKWAKTGTIFRPKKASYAPTGYQNDHIDVLPSHKKAAAADTDSKAPDTTSSLAVLSAVLPSTVSGLGGGTATSGAGGGNSFPSIAPANYRMLTALMAAGGLQPPLGSGQGANQ